MAMRDEARSAAVTWRGALLLIFCLLVAGGMRARETRHPLSFDEIFLLAGSSGHGYRLHDWVSRPGQVQLKDVPLTELRGAESLGAIWTHAVPYHPPLYILSLRIWRELFGESDRVASAYSGFCSVLAIGLAFLALRRQVGDGLATLACLILAVAPMQVHLGTELRGYALVFLLTAWAAWLMVGMEDRNPTTVRVWLLGLTTLPLMLTHYFALGTCLAILAWGCLRLPRRDLPHFLGSLVVSGLLFALVWGPFFIHNISSSGAPFLNSSDPFWRRSLVYALDLPMRLLVYPGSRPLMAAASLFLVGLVVVAMRRRDGQVLPWALLLLGPLLLLLSIDALRSTKHTAFARYFAIATIGMPTASLVAAFRWRPQVAWAVGVVLLGWAVATWNAPRDVGSIIMQPARGLLVPAIEAGPAARPIVFWTNKRQNSLSVTMGLYMELLHAGLHGHPMMFLKAGTPMDVGSLRDACDDGRFWLVVPSAAGQDGALPSKVAVDLPGVEFEGPPVSVPRGPGYVSPRPPATLWLARLRPAGSE